MCAHHQLAIKLQMRPWPPMTGMAQESVKGLRAKHMQAKTRRALQGDVRQWSPGAALQQRGEDLLLLHARARAELQLRGRRRRRLLQAGAAGGTPGARRRGRRRGRLHARQPVQQVRLRAQQVALVRALHPPRRTAVA